MRVAGTYLRRAPFYEHHQAFQNVYGIRIVPLYTRRRPSCRGVQAGSSNCHTRLRVTTCRLICNPALVSFHMNHTEGSYGIVGVVQISNVEAGQQHDFLVSPR